MFHRWSFLRCPAASLPKTKEFSILHATASRLLSTTAPATGTAVGTTSSLSIETLESCLLPGDRELIKSTHGDLATLLRRHPKMFIFDMSKGTVSNKLPNPVLSDVQKAVGKGKKLHEAYASCSKDTKAALVKAGCGAFKSFVESHLSHLVEVTPNGTEVVPFNTRVAGQSSSSGGGTGSGGGNASGGGPQPPAEMEEIVEMVLGCLPEDGMALDFDSQIRPRLSPHVASMNLLARRINRLNPSSLVILYQGGKYSFARCRPSVVDKSGTTPAPPPSPGQQVEEYEGPIQTVADAVFRLLPLDGTARDIALQIQPKLADPAMRKMKLLGRKLYVLSDPRMTLTVLEGSYQAARKVEAPSAESGSLVTVGDAEGVMLNETNNSIAQAPLPIMPISEVAWLIYQILPEDGTEWELEYDVKPLLPKEIVYGFKLLGRKLHIHNSPFLRLENKGNKWVVARRTVGPENHPLHPPTQLSPHELLERLAHVLPRDGSELPARHPDLTPHFLSGAAGPDETAEKIATSSLAKLGARKDESGMWFIWRKVDSITSTEPQNLQQRAPRAFDLFAGALHSNLTLSPEVKNAFMALHESLPKDNSEVNLAQALKALPQFEGVWPRHLAKRLAVEPGFSVRVDDFTKVHYVWRTGDNEESEDRFDLPGCLDKLCKVVPATWCSAGFLAPFLRGTVVDLLARYQMILVLQRFYEYFDCSIGEADWRNLHQKEKKDADHIPFETYLRRKPKADEIRKAAEEMHSHDEWTAEFIIQLAVATPATFTPLQKLAISLPPKLRTELNKRHLALRDLLRKYPEFFEVAGEEAGEGAKLPQGGSGAMEVALVRSRINTWEVADANPYQANQPEGTAIDKMVSVVCTVVKELSGAVGAAPLEDLPLALSGKEMKAIGGDIAAFLQKYPDNFLISDDGGMVSVLEEPPIAAAGGSGGQSLEGITDEEVERRTKDYLTRHSVKHVESNSRTPLTVMQIAELRFSNRDRIRRVKERKWREKEKAMLQANKYSDEEVLMTHLTDVLPVSGEVRIGILLGRLMDPAAVDALPPSLPALFSRHPHLVRFRKDSEGMYVGRSSGTAGDISTMELTHKNVKATEITSTMLDPMNFPFPMVAEGEEEGMVVAFALPTFVPIGGDVLRNYLPMSLRYIVGQAEKGFHLKFPKYVEEVPTRKIKWPNFARHIDLELPPRKMVGPGGTSLPAPDGGAVGKGVTQEEEEDFDMSALLAREGDTGEKKKKQVRSTIVADIERRFVCDIARNLPREGAPRRLEEMIGRLQPAVRDAMTEEQGLEAIRRYPEVISVMREALSGLGAGDTKLRRSFRITALGEARRNWAVVAMALNRCMNEKERSRVVSIKSLYDDTLPAHFRQGLRLEEVVELLRRSVFISVNEEGTFMSARYDVSSRESVEEMLLGKCEEIIRAIAGRGSVEISSVGSKLHTRDLNMIKDAHDTLANFLGKHPAKFEVFRASSGHNRVLGETTFQVRLRSPGENLLAGSAANSTRALS